MRFPGLVLLLMTVLSAFVGSCRTTAGKRGGAPDRALYDACYTYMYKRLGCDDDGPGLCKDRGFEQYSGRTEAKARKQWLVQHRCPKAVAGLEP